MIFFGKSSYYYFLILCKENSKTANLFQIDQLLIEIWPFEVWKIG